MPLSGFDMLRVRPDCTQYFAISTVFGVFRMLATPMGFVNTPFIYQERIVAEILGGVNDGALFGRPHSGVLQWLDDSLVYSETFEQHLQTLETLLKNCQDKKLRLNIDKCDLIKREAVWCGREISEKGWKFQSKYYDNILQMPVPKNLGQLEDCVYLSQWLSPSIPAIARYKTDFMNLATDMKKELNVRKGRRVTRKTRSTTPLGEHWNETLTEKFHEFKNVIKVASESHLALYSVDQDIFILTDASKLYWSGVLASGQGIAAEEITNVLKSQASAISEKLSMRPMYFVSGAFKGSQYHWSMPDKEMYPILKILLRFRFITMSHPKNIKVFCDHKNMEYLLNPPRTLKAAAISRLYRWVLLLQNFKLTVFHLKGEFNKFADVLSRWAHLGQSIEEIEEQERAKELFRPTRTANKRVSGTIELIDPPEIDANWFAVAQYVARGIVGRGAEAGAR